MRRPRCRRHWFAWRLLDADKSAYRADADANPTRASIDWIPAPMPPFLRRRRHPGAPRAPGGPDRRPGGQPGWRVHELLAEKRDQALEFPCSIPVSQHWLAVLCNEEQRLMSEATKGQFLSLDHHLRAGIDSTRNEQTDSFSTLSGACPAPRQALPARIAEPERSAAECRHSACPGPTGRRRRGQQSFSSSGVNSPEPGSAIRLPEPSASLFAGCAAGCRSRTPG